MKGYKAFDKDLKSEFDGTQYEIGKIYELEGSPVVCGHGFHFCQKAPDVFNYYSRRESRVCEVEALGDVATRGDKSATNKILIVREIDGIECSRLFYGYGYGYGYGDGYGYGYGDGYGDGYGYGYGDGYGSGYGYGYGYGYGKKKPGLFELMEETA